MKITEWMVLHDPEGWACNQQWILVAPGGEIAYRGPRWAALLRLHRVTARS